MCRRLTVEFDFNMLVVNLLSLSYWHRYTNDMTDKERITKLWYQFREDIFNRPILFDVVLFMYTHLFARSFFTKYVG